MGVQRVVTTDDDEMIVDEGHWMHDSWIRFGIGSRKAKPLCQAGSRYPWFLATAKSVPDCPACMPAERIAYPIVGRIR